MDLPKNRTIAKKHRIAHIHYVEWMFVESTTLINEDYNPPIIESMLKFLLIIFVVFYILIKVGGFIMKTLFSGFANGEQNSHRTQQNQYRSTRTKDGSVNIDYIPNQDKTKSGKKNFPGGDYVDYEEVK